MEYSLEIDGRVYPVTATPSDRSETFCVSVADHTQMIVSKSISPSRLQFQVGDRLINLFFAPTPEGTWIWVEGRPRFVRDADQHRRRTSRRPGETAAEVTPPTPATVVKVLTEVGARVEKGDPLVVVSAMKMEITLSAPYAGTVRAVNTTATCQVCPGEILVEIDALTEEVLNE